MLVESEEKVDKSIKRASRNFEKCVAKQMLSEMRIKGKRKMCKKA